MNRLRGKRVSQILMAGLFIAIFAISMFSTLTIPTINSISPQNPISTVNSPLTASTNSQSAIIGTGANQSVRLDLSNSSTGHGVDEINITANSDKEYLSKGQFNLTLPQSLTTEYQIEDDNSLDIPQSKIVATGTTGNKLTLKTGALLDGSDTQIFDDNPTNYATYQSSTNELKLIHRAMVASTGFNSSEILGFNTTMLLSGDVNTLLTISLWDNIGAEWDTVLANYRINKTTSMTNPLEFKFLLRNENLRYTNSSRNVTLQYRFYNASVATFNLRFFYIKFASLKGYEYTLRNSKSVALEFDTKGPAKLRGFNVWIRSLNATKFGNLSIQIVNAINGTILQFPMKRSQLLNKTISTPRGKPDMSTILHSQIIPNYSWDRPIWINLSTTIDLPIGNYFIVLRTQNTYDLRSLSLVILPDSQLGSNMGYDNDLSAIRVDHLLLRETVAWDYIKISPYNDPICDAAPFKLNITRGWYPTELNLTIYEDNQYKKVENTYNYQYPVDTTGKYAAFWWGLGTIEFDRSFTETGIKAEAGNFTVPLYWRTANLTNIAFDLKYSVEKYVLENATSIFVLLPNKLPQWNVTLDFSVSNYPYWQIQGMTFYYSTLWSLKDAYDTNDYSGRNFFENMTSGIITSQRYAKFYPKDLGFLINGKYTIITESPNFIASHKVYQIYENNLWETNGFMPGDKISAQVGVKYPSGEMVEDNGVMNISIFDSTGSRITTAVDSQIDQFKDASWYKFDQAILMDTDGYPAGNYTTVAYWSDQHQAGISLDSFYIDSFGLQTPTITGLPKNGVTRLQGLVDIATTNLDYYDLFVYSSREFTNAELISLASNYLINESVDVGLGNEIYLTRFAQNESIFNAGETVQFKIDLENLHPVFSFNVSVTVNLISILNEKWVITNASSVYKSLSYQGIGDNSDFQQYNVNLNIPTVAMGGINCPIRHAPMKIQVDVKINDNLLAKYTFPELYLYLENTTFEGKLLAVYQLANRVGRPYLTNIDRLNVNLPGTTFYYIEAVNSYNMAVVGDHKYVHHDDIASRIDGFKVTPENNLNLTNSVNLTGQVVDEHGGVLPNQNISLSYFIKSTVEWREFEITPEVNTFTTDFNGSFNLVLTLDQLQMGSNLIRASYLGDAPASIVGFDQNLTIIINQNVAKLTLTVIKEKLSVGSQNVQKFTFTNEGNSTLRQINLFLNPTSDFKGEIYSESLDSLILRPGESFTVQIRLWNYIYTDLSAKISIRMTSWVDEIGSVYSYTYIEEFPVYRINEENFVNLMIVGLFVASVVVIWFASVRYSLRKYRELNELPTTQIAPIKPKAPVTGKYINLADLKEKKSGTSLDDLIKEQANLKEKEEK